MYDIATKNVFWVREKYGTGRQICEAVKGRLEIWKEKKMRKKKEGWNYS